MAFCVPLRSKTLTLRDWGWGGGVSRSDAVATAQIQNSVTREGVFLARVELTKSCTEKIVSLVTCSHQI